jgi:hypothetical protein
MPGSDRLAQLDRALAQAADALAELSPGEWDRLCREEAADLVATHQYFETFGYPDAFPPERVLGHRILEIFAARYPALAQDPAGSA